MCTRVNGTGARRMCKGTSIFKDLYLQIFVLQETHLNVKVYVNFVELEGPMSRGIYYSRIHTKLSKKGSKVHTLEQAVT